MSSIMKPDSGRLADILHLLSLEYVSDDIFRYTSVYHEITHRDTSDVFAKSRCWVTIVRESS